MTVREYKGAIAFKQALEQRLRTGSGSGVDFARRRQRVVFDRFLARVTEALGDAVTLKGGLAVELRLERARATKDVDLRLTGTPETILETLRLAAARSLGDFMVFTIRPDDRHPAIQNEGMQYEGLRFRAECTLAGKVYGRPFGVDVAFGDPMMGEPDTIVADDLLGFAGVPPPTLRLYPVATHIAEKLHAYTLPRARPNTRVKDLPDLALIATAGPLSQTRLALAIQQTFGFRDTHPAPVELPAPPEAWAQPYMAMAKEDLLRWPDLASVYAAAQALLDPALTSSEDARWDPATWTWHPI